MDELIEIPLLGGGGRSRAIPELLQLGSVNANSTVYQRYLVVVGVILQQLDEGVQPRFHHDPGPPALNERSRVRVVDPVVSADVQESSIGDSFDGSKHPILLILLAVSFAHTCGTRTIRGNGSIYAHLPLLRRIRASPCDSCA